IKIVEYMILKKPILDASDGDDLVFKAKAGISIQNENSQELSKTILKMSKMDKRLLQKMGQNGHDYVCENYMYVEIVSRMLKQLN
ncbi:hypothetical protein OAN36_05775, partial [Flavobacteriaceae bacterium]|nr:hypothetical protein [Flavobacteriaceae bacterium]